MGAERPLLVLLALVAPVLAYALPAALPLPHALPHAAPGGEPAARASAPPPGPVFGAPVRLPSSLDFGEPSIALGPDGILYVAAPGGDFGIVSTVAPHTAVWASPDGSAWERRADTRGGSGDSDIAVDATGRVYASDLFPDVPVSVSSDGARRWDYATATAGTGGPGDRQWLAARGDGLVWSAWRDGSAVRVARSTDRGLTYASSVAAEGAGLQGGLVAASDTLLCLPFERGDTLHVARSRDGGATWSASALVGSGRLALFPSLAVDDAGRVYVAWAEAHGATYHVHLAAGDGAAWGPVQTLSSPGRYHVMAWVVAGAPGRVAVAWYEGEPPGGAVGDSALAPLTTWRVRFAFSADADAPSPAWASVLATGVIHEGPVCAAGSLCSPLANPLYGDRSLLDFFEMTERDGKAVIAFTADEGPGHTTLWVAAQTGGPTLR